jgi:2-dehydropantoate 2-reductase
VVGAGATGGYIGATLVAAGRDVTFLVRQARQAQLQRDGLVIRRADGDTVSTAVRALTRSQLQQQFDAVILAVRAGAVEQAVADMATSVGESTFIVPVVNGMAHLDVLSDHFGAQRVVGAAARLLVSLRNSVIEETQPGTSVQIGALDQRQDSTLDVLAGALSVDGLTVTITKDVVDAMWSKFAFITATAALTCLTRQAIGPIARNSDGIRLAQTVLAEVDAVAAAEGHPLSSPARQQLLSILTDPDSTFAPSMFRDLMAGLPTESEVLRDITERAHRHGLDVPVLNAAQLVVTLHNQTAST